MTGSEISVVTAWHDALNHGDVDRLLALSHLDIEVGGPRGSSRGVDVLREWVERAGIHLELRRVFRRADTVVAEQAATWRSADTGEVTDRQTVASVFVVRDGRVARVLRHPDLVDALRAVGFDELRAVGTEQDMV